MICEALENCIAPNGREYPVGYRFVVERSYGQKLIDEGVAFEVPTLHAEQDETTPQPKKVKRKKNGNN